MSYINFSNDRKKLHSEESKNSSKRFRIATLVGGALNQTGQIIEFDKTFYYAELQGTCSADYITNYLKSNFASFETYEANNVLKMNSTEIVDFLNNFNEHVCQISKDLCVEPPEAVHILSRELEAKKLLVEPDGVAGLVHRVQLIGVAAGSSIYSAYSVSLSSMTGTTGLMVLKATPLVVLTVPTLFGVGFGACERVFYGSYAGNVSSVLKTVCLVPLWCSEYLYNGCVAPVISMVTGIDAPLNFTSYLKYGSGITPAASKKVMSAVKNPNFWNSLTAFFRRR